MFFDARRFFCTTLGSLFLIIAYQFLQARTSIQLRPRSVESRKLSVESTASDDHAKKIQKIREAIIECKASLPNIVTKNEDGSLHIARKPAKPTNLAKAANRV